MLLYVDEGVGVGSPPQRTRWPGPPSGSLRPALGWDPVAERWRLQRASDGPTGTQLLCRSIGSFTACRITHNPVLTGASQEHLLPTLPCPGHFTARQEAENITRKMLFTHRGQHRIKIRIYALLSLVLIKGESINKFGYVKMFTFLTFSDLQPLRHICVFTFDGFRYLQPFSDNLNWKWWESAATCWPSQKAVQAIFIWLPLQRKSGKTKTGLLFLRESCAPYRILNGDFPLYTITESSSVSHKDFKEFYWNKDKFQSQSLKVFRKKKKGKETCFGF